MTQPTSSAVRGTSSAATGPYVINLCASTTPMALSRPTAPELARFTFFVSRRREEGRERFRLHMGYFATRDEAEQLLTLIRDLYPAAWVGEAPGKRLAQRTATGAAPTAAPSPSPVGNATSAPLAPAKPATPAAMKPAAPRTVQAPPAAAQASTRSAKSAPQAPAVASRAAAAASQRSAAPAPAPAAAPAVTRVPPSNVREVINALDAATPAAPRAAPSPPAAPVTAAKAVSAAAPRPAPGPAPARTPPAVAKGAATATSKRDELSDSQVLRILETRRANALAQADATPEQRAPTDIRMLSPDDTHTWRDIKSQLSRDAAVHFAVQLEWSVTPIDLDRVPPLAIFNAYTLYKIEGNRDGRKWYGLRLGFFSDAVAARQVALYIRSEFATVAVVPVSAKERGDATQVGAIELSRPVTPAPAKDDDAIELIDDAVEAALSRSEQPAADPEAALAGLSAAPPPATNDTAAPRRQGRPRGSPQTLEETLEILGASQLSIDNGNGVRLDLSGGARRSEPRNSTFSKLLDRLSEKLRG